MLRRALRRNGYTPRFCSLLLFYLGRSHRTAHLLLCPHPSLPRQTLLLPCPFAFWLRSGTGAREGSFALSRGRESRVTVCRVCMGISQVHGFLRERRTSSPGRNVRSLCTGVRGGRVGERKRIGDYMTMMAILKHNILCGTRKRDVGRQYDGGR